MLVEVLPSISDLSRSSSYLVRKEGINDKRRGSLKAKAWMGNGYCRMPKVTIDIIIRELVQTRRTLYWSALLSLHTEHVHCTSPCTRLSVVRRRVHKRAEVSDTKVLTIAVHGKSQLAWLLF